MSGATTEWTNEFTLKFVDVYQGEPVIWNPKHRLHKDKVAVNDAWTGMGRALNMTVTELKKKKDSLMASFRHHLRRKKASIKSGRDDVYRPTWFAFETMEKFLLPVYENEPNYTAEYASVTDEEEDLSVDDDDPPAMACPTGAAAAFPSSKRRRGKQPPAAAAELEEARKQMNRAFSTLSDVLVVHNRAEKDDECDLYGKLIAKKLRRIPESERELLMYEIDGLFLSKGRAYRPSSSIPSSLCSVSS